MYADQRYTPRSPRSVSFGAAFAINGLVIAGLMSFVPTVIGTKRPPGPIQIYTPFDPPPPKPVEVEKQKLETKPQQVELYIPTPPIPQLTQPEMTGTTVMPTEAPPIGPVEQPGPTNVLVEPPAALPPLIGAKQDPRFASAYQPEYPASELRAQRDGMVSVRVLIGTDGRVKAVEQVSATTAAFFEATKRQALSKWRFKPATRGGVPQESWKTMSVRFEIKNA
ncbi:MAG: energy transducer TonB [Sphingomonadales bacterium]|nr:MAG: energy transducer TonB [Sphingomonadales bacterium]